MEYRRLPSAGYFIPLHTCAISSGGSVIPLVEDETVKFSGNLEKSST